MAGPVDVNYIDLGPARLVVTAPRRQRMACLIRDQFIFAKVSANATAVYKGIGNVSHDCRIAELKDTRPVAINDLRLPIVKYVV